MNNGYGGGYDDFNTGGYDDDNYIQPIEDNDILLDVSGKIDVCEYQRSHNPKTVFPKVRDLIR
jgi:hypothetical protein